ncbi:DUF3461 family protein [Phocoenobacter skyensis]|uniref:DUF3461 family protein n=1 Tax=Phocoenobacter skyensis TaxID=97481 RepID=A0A1H7VXY0_9PAST|nr:DUF3461 family protein [Pasteurella skyensis]MDP8079056.1 DUF3461 family protein [Pasteurella skyensis]MDP8085006.1 DUF3461 family protein [Pasteurella skyensis]MDP8184927.1 DUF3461 family protein [Pasteurella skyensis]QLB21759.1 hypothetical protein A6B44_00405 [Pasteurella skyensis]SEM14103.1 Protein of unknown function [Pasteurella skyensis]
MEYPTLKKLDITRPHQIRGYTLSTSGNIDTLRIRYARKKGSLLPTSKRFKFSRHPMKGMNNENELAQSVVTEVSPVLTQVLLELETLLAAKKSTKNKKEQLLKEINDFEKDIEDFHNLTLSQLASFRADIEKL